MSNWLECSECHVGCKPHEDWCSRASDEWASRMRQYAPTMPDLSTKFDSGPIIFRAPKPRDFYPPSERGHSTVLGVVTLLPTRT